MTELDDSRTVNSPAQISTRPRRAVVPTVVALFSLAAVTILLQWLSGAYRADFTGYADEPSHYVTGLMIRDFIVSGDWTHPVKFAENYYLHYPKVAFGMWGPLLHVAGGAWMLLFSASRVSILVFMALITALLATTTWFVVREHFTVAAAWGGGWRSSPCR